MPIKKEVYAKRPLVKSEENYKILEMQLIIMCKTHMKITVKLYWRCKQTSCIHGIEKIIVKVAVFPESINRFNAIPQNYNCFFFADMNQLVLQFIWKYKGPQTAKTIMKKNKISTHTSQFQNVIQSYSNQTVCYWHKDRYTDQWNKNFFSFSKFLLSTYSVLSTVPGAMENIREV